MSATATRKQILDALKARLAVIDGTGPFATDAGLRVTLGKRFLTGDDTKPQLALAPGKVKALAGDEYSLESYRARLPVEIHGVILAGDPDQLGPAEALLADIKRAVFLPADRKLAGLANDVLYLGGDDVGEREEGGSHVGCTLPLEVDYFERYGVPV